MGEPMVRKNSIALQEKIISFVFKLNLIYNDTYER